MGQTEPQTVHADISGCSWTKGIPAGDPRWDLRHMSTRNRGVLIGNESQELALYPLEAGESLLN